MTKRFDIIGIGDADMDIMVKADHIPAHDEKVKGHIIGKFPGGIISNFLCAASKFGSRCGAVVCVGQDDFGRIALDELRMRGIDTEKCVIHPDDDTYFTVTCLDDTGEKSMLLCLNNSTQPRPEEVDLEYLSQASFVHMIGTYRDLVLSVARHGGELGFRLSLDFEAQAFEISQEDKEEICSLAYIAFPNEAGLRYMTGCTSVEEGARKMLAWGTEIVVVTLGARGVEVFTSSEHIRVPAFQVEVKDTTGAGDTFNASFLSCLSKGYSLLECAWLATASAACQIQKVGARDGMVTEEECRTWLAAHKEKG